ncbi:MMPL family transporter [Actinocrispum wychmicini]|uniref:RND superfamily putative drug exporter n=1 Tax=Actinocrispum wychmicini TaxID=1213861 RepID=A0A4R2JLQ6_9PSEU|nr:MMPL family transporter [Actinocrispum wychmicini]TCO61003.1 RND superfamily putative drug exporter [Actinocrispum wychmicini]
MNSTTQPLRGVNAAERGFFAALGRFVVHRPWWVIAAWVLLAAVVVLTAPALPKTTDQSDALPRDSESIQAAQVGQQAFPTEFTPSMIIVFQRADDKPLAPGDSAKVTDIVRAVDAKHIGNVEQILAGSPAPNGSVQIGAVKMPEINQSNLTDLTAAAKQLRAELKSAAASTGLKVGTTGSVAQQLDMQESSTNGDALVLLATVLLILVLLLVIFRSPIIALLPIVLIGIVSQVANGLIAHVVKAFGLKTDASIASMLIVVLFGVGTDYILFLMFRFRERLRAGDGPKQAMVTAVSRVGEAITTAAVVVMIAFAAMTLSSFGFFRSMGPALAIAVGVTLLAGITLVPAVVSLMGSKVFWPSKSWRREPKAARFGAVGRVVGRRPALVAVVSGAVMVALGVGMVSLNPTFDLSSGSMPATAESQVALKDLKKGMPAGATSPTNVYLRAENGQRLDEAALSRFAAKLKVDGVSQVSPPTQNGDHNTASFSVALGSSPESDAAIDTVDGPLRDAAHAAAPPGTKAFVGGETAVYADVKETMHRDYLLVFPVAALLIMLLLGLMLRSVVSPWYVMASVGLGFAATLGATTLVFQVFGGQPGLIFMIPLIIYMFVVALGTDYNILMMARLREEAKEGRSPREAAALAVRHTGPTIAAAGVILAGSLGALMLAGNTMLAEMGFALAFGILVAAFVMAMFFVPSLTALIGRAAWWPGRGHRTEEPKTVPNELQPVGAPWRRR